jgi:acyl carrier protein
MSQGIQDKLLDFITQSFFVEKDDIELEKSLMDTGIIDSAGLIEIVVFIEQEFSMVVDDDQMTRENLGSVVKIVNFIKKELVD